MFYRKFHIRTESMTDFGLEPAEQTLIKSVYYAEAHVAPEPEGNPFKVTDPAAFWRQEAKDWQEDAKQNAAECEKFKAKAAEAEAEAKKWRKTAEDNDANCDHLRRKFFNEQANHHRTKTQMQKEINQLKQSVVDREIGLAKAAGDVDRLKKDNNILCKMVIDLFARLNSWQQMAKHQFRKNKDLEIEAICNECRIDEAYDRIRELEEELAEKDVIIDEIIASAEEAAEEWAKATEEAEIKAYKLAVELAEKNWIISQYKEKEETEEMYAEATSVGNLITVAKEIAGYEIDQVFIEAGSDKPSEYEITRQELNNKIICGLVQIREEATDIESLWRVEKVCKEIDDILNTLYSLAE